MPEWTENLTPECHCPFCDYRVDRASGYAAPKPGDLAVCAKCASPLRYADDMTLCAMTPGEIDDLHPQTKAELRRYMAAVRALDRSSIK